MSDQDFAARTATSRSVEESLGHRALLATIRHELRTPINAIIGYSEMLLEDADDRGRADFVSDLQKIRAAGGEILGLVNEILDPAKIEAGTLDTDLETVGASLCHALLTPINAVIGYSEMLLEDAASTDGEAFVLDLQRIHAAATHFLSLTTDIVSFQRHALGDAEGVEAATFVTDLATADTSAMVQDAVTTIRSLGEQTTGIPVADSGPVLVVDDNVINREILARRLQREGLTVVVAADGRQALEMLAAQKFDLVLLDIIMPEMNGFQVLQHLKSDASLRDIPVVMISALEEIDSVVRCLEMGAEDYLPKPFNPVILKARVGASLEKKRLRDQEVEYLRNVNRVTAAAGEVEAGRFDPESLTEVATRRDELGQLARVFQRMAREVAAREERLKQQVQELRIEIDEVKKARAVAEITETEYFQQLQAKARQLRKRT